MTAGRIEGVVFPLGLLVMALLAICATFHQNVVCLLACSAILAAALLVQPSRFKWVMAGLALPFGTLGEYLCSDANLWRYANPTLAGLPIWLPLIWPILMTSDLQLAGAADAALSRRLPARANAWVLAGLKALVLAYAVFTLLWIQPTIALILGGFLALMLLFARRRFNWLLFVIAALVGSFGELVCIQFGVWHYTTPAFAEIGFPLSLPLAWGLSANLIWMLATLLTGGYARRPVASGQPA